MKNAIKLMVTVLGFLTVTTACNPHMRQIQKLENKTIFTLIDDKTVLLDGVINSKALGDFNELYAENPTIKLIKIKQCDGSVNDEVNLKLGKRIHDLKLNTHLMDNGIIASGGVDFFLAGIKRTAGKNTKMGVHSWAGSDEIATNFPVGHTEHQFFIDYYKSIGFSDKDAKAFYYFTINAAPAESMHWMTNEELKKYNVIKYPLIKTRSKKQDVTSRLHDIWVATSLNGKELTFNDEKNRPRLEIQIAERKIYGKGTCNTFFGDIENVSETQLEISDKLGSTLMACPEMEIETDFFNTLPKVKTYKFVDNNLLLLDTENSEILRFKRVD